MIKTENIKDIIFENKLIVLLYLFSTMFFIYQHTTGISWDFAAYVLNAKYIFSNGFYFELLRPPLASVLIGLFSLFGWLVAEYMYLIFVSSLYLISCLKISEILNVDKRIFYTLSINPFLLLFGLSVGTELLSLALLQLFVFYLLKNDGLKSGTSFALNALLRYTNFIYLPVVLFTKNFKKIAIFIGISILLFLPWLWFNLAFSGSPLTSFADYYALNIKYRDYMFMPFDIYDFILVVNYLLPLFLIGLWLKVSDRRMNRKDWVMILILIITFFSYYNASLKYPRFLFNLILPFVYFSVIGLERFKIKAEHIGLLNICLGVFILWTIIISPSGATNSIFSNPSDYPNVTENCMISSNRWVIINYLGRPAEPNPRDFRVREYLDKGYRIVIYKDPEPDYARNSSFLKQFPVIEETERYVILGDRSKCMEPYVFDKTYLEQLNESLYLKYNFSVETNFFRMLLS